VRLPRIFGKKRGHRRTGSQAWGTFGDGAFHAALVIGGIVFGTLLISGVAVPAWRINHEFVETRCRIVATGLVKRTHERPPGKPSVTWRPCVRVRYQADGQTRETWNSGDVAAASADRSTAVAALANWPLGSEARGWYDPATPETIVLRREYDWWTWLLTLLLPGALVAFGGSGLARAVSRWGRSEEAIAAASGRLPDLFVAREHGSRAAAERPGIPPCDDLVNSPGTLLRYRLPIESPENWALIGIGLFALLWNTVLIVLAVGAGLDLAGGHRDWLLLAVLVPCCAVGIAAIAMFIRGLVLATAVGTTHLEIADHPLLPGCRYEAMISQGGSGTLRELTVTLAVEEVATFRQGTDTRSERLVVGQLPVGAWRDVQLAPGTNFEARFPVVIPDDAMHSFVSEHNAVRWQLLVRGTPARWPAFVRTFPVVVHPRPSGAPSRPGGHRLAAAVS
jgi:hypothetical protein